MQPGQSHTTYSLLCFEFHCPREGNARFRIEVVPETETNKSVRETILDQIAERPQVFNRAGQWSSVWPLVHMGELILGDADLGKWDDPSTRAKIEAWVEKFATEQFPAMNEVIVECLQEYAAESTASRD